MTCTEVKIFLKHRERSKDLNKQLFRQEVHITVKHEKRANSIEIKDMQSKTTKRHCAFTYQISKDLKMAMLNAGKKHSHEPPL